MVDVADAERELSRGSLAMLRDQRCLVVVVTCSIATAALCLSLFRLHPLLTLGFAGGGALAGFDLATGVIPNSIVVPMIPAVIVLTFVGGSTATPAGLLGGFVLAGPWLVMALINPRVIGGGDVKLLLVLGVLLGGVSWSAVKYGLAGSFAIWWLHAVVARLRRRTAFRFGPGLVTAALVAIWMTNLTGGTS